MNIPYFKDKQDEIEHEEIQRKRLINRLLQAIVNILSFVNRIVRGKRTNN